MILSKEESSLFFKLYKPLLNFVRPIKTESIAEYVKSKTKLFDNPSLIQKFVTANPLNFTSAELEIIIGWQKFIFADFVFLKQLQDCAIFHTLGEGEPGVYAVLGLNDSMINIVGFAPARLANVTLLPFAGKIVCDGLFYLHPVIFGRNYCESFNETYKESRKDHSIVRTIE